MYTYKKSLFILLLLSMAFVACNRDKKSDNDKNSFVIAKGLYNFGPEVKSFTDCEEGREYWVADSAKTLELSYSQLGFEKPYVPVYIEVECHFVKSDTTTVTGDYDSTMVVTKLLKISKQVPDGPCSQ